ncbi:hypothetical protein D9M68_826240 [compost metagenome]
MGHANHVARVVQCDGQGVVAHDPYGRRRDRGGQRAVAGSCEQQIAVDGVAALEHGLLACARQRPDLATALENTCRLHLVAADLGEVAIELEDRARLHDLVAAADDRQCGPGVAAVEHLLLGEGFQDLKGITFGL